MVSTTISLDNKTPSTSDNKAIAVPLPTTTSVQKLDLSSSLNEKISILFPKCRPKSDINLNPMNNNSMTTPPSSSLSSESSAATKSPNINTNPFLMSRQPVEKTSYYYKTKEDYDFQPSSAVSNYTQKLLSQKPAATYYNSSQNPFIKDSHWETRKRTPVNTTPASTVLNSPDLTEIETRVAYPKTGHHIRVGRSPVNHTDGSNSVEVVSPTKMAVEDGEVVVFDDIGENWQSTYKFLIRLVNCIDLD